MKNKGAAEGLRKTIIRKFEKQKVNSYFVDIIRDVDLADMQLLSKFNKGIRFFMLLIIIVNMLGLFLGKTRKVLQLLILFEKY